MAKPIHWLSTRYLTAPLLLILSGCATPPQPVSPPPSPAARLYVPPMTKKPSTPISRPNLANNRYDFESVWHEELRRDRKRSIHCVSLEKVQDPDASKSCWSDLANHFLSQAQWIHDIVPQASIPTSAKWTHLLQAEHSAISFFEHSAHWAKGCGTDFGSCLQKAGTLQTIKAKVEKEIELAQ